MGRKYIIELEDKNVWECGYPDRTLSLDMTVLGKALTNVNTGIPLTPYTEPDMEQVRKEAYEEGYKKCLSLNNFGHLCVSCDKYEQGLADAWKAARKIIHMPEADLLNIFDECYAAVCTSVQVFLKYDASECIEKIRAYEQEKEEQDGLRQNIQTIVDQCGYTLDEIAEVLQKMREESNG